MALATPNQLWRLNKEGRLAVVPGSVPLTHVDADRAIKDALAAAFVEEQERKGLALSGGCDGGTSEALEA